ncbi:MAG: PD-(D/E)XK nuclease family protein, partial [Candidatus Didemnitutus sp.]|nr:PD-(D/E)XK nuclease family protein [Candidatus Didemnitutus sp.]
IGVPDLILRHTDSVIVVDHKTSKTFNDLDPAQLVLYAEHIRRQQNTRCVVGAFDEYRLVPDLTKIRKPVFRRTPVSVDRSLLPALARRYRQAWVKIQSIDRDGQAEPAFDCWICNGANSW